MNRQLDILSDEGSFLRDVVPENVYSQFGEDAVIEACLAHYGAINEWCFEVGAADGVFFSNTLRLREMGWSAVLIEQDETHYSSLENHASERVHCVHASIGDLTIDEILAEANAPTNLDFGVIDIDGQDYYAWFDMVMYRPRIICVEHAPGPHPLPDRYGDGQAGRQIIVELGRSKQYVPLAATLVNAFFVDERVVLG